jgi:hypothetical protein
MAIFVARSPGARDKAAVVTYRPVGLYDMRDAAC